MNISIACHFAALSSELDLHEENKEYCDSILNIKFCFGQNLDDRKTFLIWQVVQIKCINTSVWQLIIFFFYKNKDF